SIYGTGMGATAVRNGLQATIAPVAAVINGSAPVAASFAGTVAGFVGLYQVNVQIPAGVAPGLTSTVVLTQGNRTGNTAAVALQ
ncbi:MAG TPA: hypothetical protein VNH18_28545, partial [Bryobacteraceae bacterium]|nr:hypothetical protein [Bryobacteraceae bacterium]